MAKFEDYQKTPSPEEDKLDAEVVDAANQQEERVVSTPDTDWEKRYKDLEVAFSRQGEQMGDYRKLVDNYISTPDEDSQETIDSSPITPDEIYENPDEAVRRAVDSHPAIQEVKTLKQEMEVNKVTALRADFDTRHPDSQQTWITPEFASWVRENPMRGELAQRANQFDMASADALFTLYEDEEAAKQTLEETQAADAVDAAGLETGVGSEPPVPERYSRSEMLEQKIRAKQGIQEAQRYVKHHAQTYREALEQGLVRD